MSDVFYATKNQQKSNNSKNKDVFYATQDQQSTLPKLYQGNGSPLAVPSPSEVVQSANYKSGINAEKASQKRNLTNIPLTERLALDSAKSKYKNNEKLSLSESVALMKEAERFSKATGENSESSTAVLQRLTGLEKENQYESAKDKIDNIKNGFNNIFLGKSKELVESSIEKYSDRLVSYLPVDEQKEYYQKKKAGNIPANLYLKSKEDDINMYQGIEAAEEYINGNFGDKLSTALYAYLGTGLEDVGWYKAYEALDEIIGGNDLKPDKTSGAEYANAYLAEYFNKKGKKFEKAIQDVVVNATTNTVAGLPGVISKNKAIGKLSFALSVFGNTYKAERENGYNPKEAALYALATATTETSLESVLGAVPGVGENSFEKLSRKVSNSAIKLLIKLFGQTGGEYIEESTQVYLDPFLRSWILGEDINEVYKKIDELSSEANYSGKIGAVSAILMSGFGTVSDIRNEKNIENYGKLCKKILENTDVNVKDLADYGVKFADNESEFYKTSKKFAEGKLSENDYNVGKLYIEASDYFANAKTAVDTVIGAKIKSENNGIQNIIAEYDNAVNNGAIFSDVIKLKADSLKNKIAQGIEISDSEIGGFSRTISANAPMAYIEGKITSDSQNEALQSGEDSKTLTPDEKRIINTPDSELTPEQMAVKQYIRESKSSVLRTATNNGIISDSENNTNGAERNVENNTQERGQIGNTQGSIRPLQENMGGNNDQSGTEGLEQRGSQSLRDTENRGSITLNSAQSEALKNTAIRNEDGTPKIVYHFTDNMDFETFAVGDIGFHFGNETQANSRGNILNKTGRVIKACLNIKNPLNISTDIMSWRPKSLAMKLLADNILTVEQYKTILELDSGEVDYNSPAAVELRRILAEKGYDGIVYPNMFEGEGESYIAFYPEQVIIVDDGKSNLQSSAKGDGLSDSEADILLNKQLQDNNDSNRRLTEEDLEDYIRTGGKLHTRNKKTRMLEAGKNPILTSSFEISEFILNVIHGKATGEVRAYGIIGNRLANAIKNKRSKLDLKGKYLELNADDLRESYKRHLAPKEKGDIPLTDGDFINIPEYLDKFDDVISINEYNGKIEIHLAKQTDDGYVRILTVSSKERSSLQVTKIIGVSKEKFEKKYGKKIERDTGSLRGFTENTESSNPSTTAQHTAGTLSDNSIPKNKETVKKDFSDSNPDSDFEKSDSDQYAKDKSFWMAENKNDTTTNETNGGVVSFDGVDTDKARHLNKAEQEKIRNVADRLGRKVIYEDFYSLDKFKGKKRIPDGYIDGNGDIHINFYAKRPIQFIFKHEITHYLKNSLPSYQNFMDKVLKSKAFEKWLHSTGYASIDELKAEIMNTYSEVKGFNEIKCYDEILADFCAGYLFGGKNAVSQKLIDAMEPTHKRTFLEVIKDIIAYFKSKFSEYEAIKAEITAIENKFIEVYKKAVAEKTKSADTQSGEQYSIANDTIYDNYCKKIEEIAVSDDISNKGKYIEVSQQTPEILIKKANANNLPMAIQFDIAYLETRHDGKIKGNYHNLGAERMKNLPELLESPEFIVKLPNGRLNVIVNMSTDKGNRSLISIELEQAKQVNGKFNKYNLIITAFGAKTGYLDKIINNPNNQVLYKKATESQGTDQLHKRLDGINDSVSNNRISQKNSTVKNNISTESENYSIPTESATDLLDRYDKGEITREELIEGISRKKTLNPVEIANSTEEEADTTPPLKRKQGEADGDKISNTYDSLLESDIFDEKFKEDVKLDSFIEKYNSVTNKETLKKAAKELDEGGRKRVQQWWTTDAEHASLIDTAMGFILMDRYQRIGDYESAVAVAERLREVGTKSGQQVQLFSILGRLDANTMAVYAQKELSKAYETMVKGRTKAWITKNMERFKLTEDEIEFIRRKTLQAAQLPEGRDKAIRLAEIATLLQDKLPAERGQAIKALQRVSLLLNPKTNIRNIVGNAGMLPVFIATDFFGSGIDKAVSKVFKTNVRTTGTFDVKSFKAMKKGAFETLDDFKRHINTRNQELNRFEIGSGKSFNENHSGKLAKQLNDCAKVLNALDRFTSFCLELGDRPFYEMWFCNSINNQMKLNKVSEPTPEMIAIASAEALQRTWQDANKVVNAVASVKGIFNQINIGGYGLGDVMIKFVKTPANLTKAIVDFSPAGLVKSIVADGVALVDAVQTGQFEAKHQKKFVDSLSKGMVGTLLYVMTAALAGKGLLSGGSDDDDDVANFEKYIQGIPEYSVKICGKWLSYEWMQPVGSVAATVSDYMQNKEKSPDNTMVQNIWLAIKTGGEVLYNQSFMTSIQNLFTADNILEGALDSIRDDPSAFFPQILSQAASAGDKYRRTTYEYDSAFKTALNNVRYKLPWERKELEKQVDVFGREVPNSQHGIINAFFNPANTFTDTSSNVTDEIYSLYKKSGNATVIPKTAPYYVKVKGTKINFSAKERMNFQRSMGKTSSDILEEMFASDSYQDLSEAEKVKAVSSVYEYALAKAKTELEYSYEVLAEIKGIRKNGEYILTKDMYDSLNKKAKQVIAEDYFLSKSESRIRDDESAARYFIKKAKN